MKKGKMKNYRQIMRGILREENKKELRKKYEKIGGIEIDDCKNNKDKNK